MRLLGNKFSAHKHRRNLEYYDALTTHDSSLSASIQSIIASEIGHEEPADRYPERQLPMICDGHLTIDPHLSQQLGSLGLALRLRDRQLREHPRNASEYRGRRAVFFLTVTTTGSASRRHDDRLGP
jgi:Glycosyl hydrolase family 65 central catalytic domain